ncbi:MAG: hypothetical protein GY924_00405 [Planctomycetaceae bacterium]|nr:hypothetical protein [Planctomycetaceae bacterium]
MMTGQEEQADDRVDDRVDAEQDGGSPSVPMTDSTVDRAPETAKAQVTSSSSDETVAEEPQPTYVPAALAMGIMMLLWGILTNWIMSAAGVLVMIWAVTGWVREMHEP